MDSFALIIFGITGNLAQIKLIPVLYDMEEKGLLPDGVIIVGIARREMTGRQLQNYVSEVLRLENIHHKHPIKEDVFKKLCERFKYLSGEIQDEKLYARLTSEISHKNRIYYLATYPELYHYIFENLQKHKLNFQNSGWVRLMIEKPIGHDLKSARELNNLLLKYFSEDQIYRLDHYLGKETIQNILTFRFSNDIFEPLINKDYIDHIQITASEDFGIGRRGGYYDQVGALRDVGQNHQLQMLSFATMDAPSEFSNEAVTAQRIKILRSLQPLLQKTIFGQYEGYRKEENVDPNSNIDTFYALKTFINSNRFQDVPVYIRAGKKLKQYVTEISIVFKNPVNRLLKHLDWGEEPNVLIYRIQPNEGIVLKILTKKPGHEVKLQPEYMQYCYRIDPHSHYIPDPYERLLIDTIRGDQTFFNDAEEVEAQWAFIDPLAKRRGKPHLYKPDSWGPKEADELIEDDGRKWLEPSMDFCRI
ncbi:glucose-6-phosphate dehydrogenase [Candidatus Daviesbacteria bacterium RIFCSPLOWO2_01_FULL_39_12]|uniref:Glucose-6-phosphate 1-dehydrogenase n=1 Tax=Candidatus Daviesbacteria bacterium RIFCSPLOWO2_01_FULL_39_12 TaxID=1797785 RepID=A0A1F5KS33_9BACT|nr:MAG: glucose-6-phosphate dehydrogenase [Candidatus Daviesbacteria bacterium RIFCSPLOWO2_01_FULL_39_12]